MTQAIKWMRTRSDRLIAWPVFPGKTTGRLKMIEIANFVRTRSGNLTTSGVFPGKMGGSDGPARTMESAYVEAA